MQLVEITVHERCIIFTSIDVTSIPTESGDTSKILKFLDVLKTIPIVYDSVAFSQDRTIQEFMRTAGTLGFVMYDQCNNGDAYYFSKGKILDRSVIVLMNISNYKPCKVVHMYSELSIEDFIDEIKEMITCPQQSRYS